MVQIRLADQFDYDGCVDVLPSSWKIGPMLARLGTQLFNNYVFVAVREGAIVGFLACDADFFDADGFYLRTVAIGERHRLDGVGLALVEHATNWAFARGARRVFADLANETLGKKLEQKLGFQKVGEIRHMHTEDVTYEIYSRKNDLNVVKGE